LPRLFIRHVDLQLNQVKNFYLRILGCPALALLLWPRLFNRHIDLQLNQVKVIPEDTWLSSPVSSIAMLTYS
jgi:hypothetical protein